MIAGSRVLITGGAGLIGSHIADQLVTKNVKEIVILDNFVRGRRENLAWACQHGDLVVIEGDIRDPRIVSHAMQNIDILFHQAAIRITQCAEQPRLAHEVLVDGSFNVLEAAVESGVRKIVAASSASVYGPADSFPTTELHHPYNNRTIYGAAKTYNEGLLRSFHEMFNLNYVCLRYFNVYGSRMDVTGAYTEVFIRWAKAISEGCRPVIFGDGTQTMDLVHVRDIARANLLAAESPATDIVCNVASGRETSLNGLARALSRVMGSSLEPEYGPERKVNPVPKRQADTRQARELIGFEAEIDLEAGLSELVEWWRQQYPAIAA